ncbi:unnamed protein product [Rangifer tarandus platyrhynchus]|uniref:Uncharacterized protein n=2 Tax=Rangifer tarandus platyrhynchus TaxID=3082113 RepID=A0AC59ZKU0_RANTA|nr:unnamed protein product [Rangifer tarandus platyrhynchus]
MLELCLWSDWGAQVELGLGTFSSFEERERMQAFYRVLATPSRKSSVLPNDSDASRLFILHCFSQRSHTAVESCFTFYSCTSTCTMLAHSKTREILLISGVEQKNYYACVPLGLTGNCTVTSSGI